jgi:uncharacterized protein YbjT (DUF2867 family)
MTMTQHYKTACIFGGTGFIGRQIVRELAAKNYRIKVATRIPERAYFLKPCGSIGQVTPVLCDYNDEKSIQNAVSGCEIVVNTVGVLYSKGENRFPKVHTELPERIAKACKKEDVRNFIHLSALGIDDSRSHYAVSKLEGEQAVLKAFKDAVILRPSIVFGEDDDFFNRFAAMAQISPILPLIGGGHTKFQPVYVGDVSDAVISCIDNKDAKGQTYHLGGTDVLTFKELFETMFTYTGNPRKLVSVPFGFAKLKGLFLSLLPKPPLTADQVESLRTDNIVPEGVLTLSDLNIAPTSLDTILPTYLGLYKPGGRFADKKAA